jgi:hemolysin III
MMGAVVAIPVTAVFVFTSSTWLNALSLAIFGIALFLLYGSSAVYHAVRNLDLAKQWRRVDHMMIFILIAGTYTPICVNVLGGAWGIGLLITIWSLAASGIILKRFWLKSPAWLNSVIYVAMGWVCVFAFAPLLSVLPEGAFTPLLLGGISYTAGSVLYAIGGRRKKKDKTAKVFGWHEVFHLFTLLGSGFHIYFMFIVS